MLYRITSVHLYTLYYWLLLILKSLRFVYELINCTSYVDNLRSSVFINRPSFPSIYQQTFHRSYESVLMSAWAVRGLSAWYIAPVSSMLQTLIFLYIVLFAFISYNEHRAVESIQFIQYLLCMRILLQKMPKFLLFQPKVTKFWRSYSITQCNWIS